MTEGLVWFRRDLRLSDNPAWTQARSRHRRIIGLFVIDPRLWNRVTPVRRNFLAGHLRSLDSAIRDLGGRLRIERGDPVELVPAVAGERPVYANVDVTPFAGRRDAAVERRVRIRWRHGTYVHPPGSVLTDAGGVYRVFTPFYRKWLSLDPCGSRQGGESSIATDPGIGIPRTPPPPMIVGEAAARARLERFAGRVDRYHRGRDRLDLDATSRLSVDLKWGAISPLAILRRLAERAPEKSGDPEDNEDTAARSVGAVRRQLAWRDFHAHLLAEYPHLVDQALKPAYDRIAWLDDAEGLTAWREGLTGFPIVDAGMRQLKAEGWLHNRIRMIAASFLVKDLLVDWRKGERWFRRMLWDGDTPQNVGNWQWVAGSGADAVPYFRIFNPVLQSRKFDPEGVYIRRWVPELAGLGSRELHAPWTQTGPRLARAGVVLGETYPRPIVDHAQARKRALAAYRTALSTGADTPSGDPIVTGTTNDPTMP